MISGLLRLGHKSQKVEALQAQLKAKGYDIAVDGDFGSGTERVVKQFQRDNNLIPDGIAGNDTLTALFGGKDAKVLSHGAVAQGAEVLGVEEAAILAVTEVESRNGGFFSDGSPKILYERHVAYENLSEKSKTLADASYKDRPDLFNPITGGYIGGSAEHTRVNEARLIDYNVAHMSCSWGLFQIMGYHAERLGYPSVGDFVARMWTSEDEQFGAFVLFIKADPDIHKALINLDFDRFAYGYNGRNYKKNGYAHKMRAAYERHTEQ